ncbi:bh protein [Neobacillus mesonae]|uniref:bh protein n=1 Tax=Neobacillus mesonae TaxID=1193713 RepID=UPI0020425614|nr:bh protein [Neobacillus mesonae]MCM3570403.1 bh protein [Neobacillus mesonae]
MKFSELDAALYCSRCHDKTLHQVEYLNNKIYSIECTNCHHKIVSEMNPMRELYKEVYKRVTSKPTRLTKEYKEGSTHFLGQLPKRVLSKPYRLKNYVSETKNALKKMKAEK